MQNALREILSRCRVSEVYRTLGGSDLRRTSSDSWRGKAVWRDGDGFNVSFDDSRGVWHDFVDDNGGGVLDLVRCMRGGTKLEAIKWLADFTGVDLDVEIPPEQREQWAAERRSFEQDLQQAKYFCRAAAALTEEALDKAKDAFFEPTPEKPEIHPSELRNLTAQLERFRSKSDAVIVEEYRIWMVQHPGWTAALIRWAQKQEQIERRTILRYLHLTSHGGRT
jgi:hypothetical protein